MAVALADGLLPCQNSILAVGSFNLLLIFNKLQAGTRDLPWIPISITIVWEVRKKVDLGR